MGRVAFEPSVRILSFGFMLISYRDYELTFSDFTESLKGCKCILLFTVIHHLSYLQYLYHLCLRHLWWEDETESINNYIS